MAENAGEIFYTVDADTSRLVTGGKAADDQLARMQGSFSKTDAAAARTQRAANDTGSAFRRMGKEADGAGRSAGGLTTKLTPLATSIAAVISIETLRRLQALSEQFVLFEARVTRLSSSSEQAAVNYQALLSIASRTGTAMGDAVKLWETLTLTLRDLGGTDAQVLRLTETLQKIGAIGGSSTEEMANALRQLGQGLAGGTLRAEEFNSILENLPQLARELAAGLGVPFGELRNLLLDGELTADRVLGAIQKRTADVDAEFAKLPRTVGQASNAIVNDLGAALAVLDKTVGASSALAKIIDAIGRGIRLTAGNLTDQERLAQLLQERAKTQELIATLERRTLAGDSGRIKAAERLAELNRQILEIQDRRVKQQKEEAAPITTGGGTDTGGSAESLKGLEALRQQAELAKLSGEARARYAAIQKLGAQATAAERAEAEALASTIYQLEQGRKADTTALTQRTAEQKKAAAEQKRAAEENAAVVLTLEQEVAQLGLSTGKLAEAQNLLKLNAYATPEQVAQVKALTAAITAQREAEANRQLLGQVDPIAGEQMNFETQLENLRKLNEAKLLEDQRYLDLKAQAETAHAEQMRILQEENFRRQSVANELLLASLDQLQQGATNALVGLVTGASNGEEAIRGLASAILNEAVGSLVQMGVQYVKNLLIGQTAQAAATAAGAASAATLAAAYAPAAALASLASFGANAAPASAGIAATVGLAQGLALSGGRQYGGPVDAGKMYRVNENGAPELFQSANGQQFMIPNRRGEVVGNGEASGEGAPQVQVSVNLIENQQKAGTVEQRQDGNNVEIDAFVADIRGGGQRSRALEQTYGLRRAGQ